MNFKVKCVVCGKITAGRLPRDESGITGDTSFWYPRRHKVNGVDCEGNIEEGEIIDAPSKSKTIEPEMRT